MAPETRSSDASATRSSNTRRRFDSLSAMVMFRQLSFASLLCAAPIIVKHCAPTVTAIAALQGSLTPPTFALTSYASTPQDLQDHSLFSYTACLASIFSRLAFQEFATATPPLLNSTSSFKSESINRNSDIAVDVNVFIGGVPKPFNGMVVIDGIQGSVSPLSLFSYDIEKTSSQYHLDNRVGGQNTPSGSMQSAVVRLMIRDAIHAAGSPQSDETKLNIDDLEDALDLAIFKTPLPPFSCNGDWTSSCGVLSMDAATPHSNRAISPNSRIKLNVGGKLFETTLSTICFVLRSLLCTNQSPSINHRFSTQELVDEALNLAIFKKTTSSVLKKLSVSPPMASNLRAHAVDFIGGEEVTQPELFNNGTVVIHDLQGSVSSSSLFSCGSVLGGSGIITDEGATIFNEMEVLQLAGKMLVELSKSQNAAAGDDSLHKDVDFLTVMIVPVEPSNCDSLVNSARTSLNISVAANSAFSAPAAKVAAPAPVIVHSGPVPDFSFSIPPKIPILEDKDVL